LTPGSDPSALGLAHRTARPRRQPRPHGSHPQRFRRQPL